MKTEAELWDLIDRVQSILGFPDDEMADLLCATRRQFRALRTGKKSPSTSGFTRLADYIGVGMDRLLMEEVDFVALGQRLAGNRSALPEKYSVGALSRKRTSIDLLNYLDTFYGWRETDRHLRWLEVDRGAFGDPNDLINLRFLSDLVSRLTAFGYSEADLARMGTLLVQSSANGEMHEYVGHAAQVADIYELKVNHLMAFYDTNFRYRTLRLDDESCVIEVRESEQALDLLKTARLGNAQLCSYRAGRFSAFPGYLGRGESQVVETHCIHRGDAACRLQVTFPRA